MATQKVLFFTAGPVPTPEELADIAKLNAAAVPGYEIGVRSGDTARVKAEYGENRLEPATYIAGSPPDEYTDAEDEDENPIYTVLDPDEIPAVGLHDDQAIVTDGVAITITGGSVEFTVVDGVITGGAFTPTP